MSEAMLKFVVWVNLATRVKIYILLFSVSSWRLMVVEGSIFVKKIIY